jgi:dipeptidyl aminopeptidase/acylaminoacyl peptidase
MVHGWVLKPYEYKPTETYPLAFLIHGGPESAWNDDWSYRWNVQLFASKSYFTVMINPQGSTGYGQKFTEGSKI